MDNTSDSSPEQQVISIPHKEIRDFEISLESSMFWIRYEKRRYPIIMTPYDFSRLFEIGGIPIESFTSDNSVQFTKAILVRAGYNICDEIYNEEGNDITPQECWPKEPGEDDVSETVFTPTSF